jgi:hypothetical protein
LQDNFQTISAGSLYSQDYAEAYFGEDYVGIYRTFT